MTIEEFKDLKPGDHVSHIPERYIPFCVSETKDGLVLAMVGLVIDKQNLENFKVVRKHNQ